MQNLHRTVCTVAVLVASLASTGCYSFTANVPGVLDLRSDGSAATPLTAEKLPVGETSREGFGSFFTGAGAQATGADVTIEDRHWWVLGLFNIVNTSAKEEMQAALGKNAMKNVYVGEQMTLIDGAITIVPNIIGSVLSWTGIGALIYIFDLFTPPMTFQASGTRIAASAGADMATPPPTDTPPPAGDVAPTPDAVPPATGGAQ